MLVSPQHFQQAELYHEAMLDARVRALAAYSWGVVDLAFDARALDSGQIAIDRFEARFRHMEDAGPLDGLSLDDLNRRWEEAK